MRKIFATWFFMMFLAVFVINYDAKAAHFDEKSYEFKQIQEFSHYIPADAGVTLHVKEKVARRLIGQQVSKAIILLHGGGTDHMIYDVPVKGYSLMNFLAEHGYDVYAVDNLGFGASTRPTDGRTISTETSAKQLIAVIRHLQAEKGIGKVDLLGDGTGAWQSVKASMEAPELVGNVILLSGFYFKIGDVAAQILPEQMFLDAPNGYMNFVPQLYPLFISSEPEVMEWVQNYYNETRSFSVGFFLESYRLPVIEDLEKFDKRVLIMNGPGDIASSKADVLELVTKIGSKDISFVYANKVGHIPFIEWNYRHIQQAVIKFLDGQ